MSVLFTAMMMTAGLSSFANERPGPDPDKQVLNQFKKEFSSAENVFWEKQDEYDKATFVLAGRRVVAYYNQDGQLEGCVRDIFFDQLPLAAMTAVDKKYSQSDVLDIKEITNSEGTNYKLTIESKGRKYKVKLTPSGNITDVEKLPR